MGVLSFLSARRKDPVQSIAPVPAGPAKSSSESALERLEARHGKAVQAAVERIREAFQWHRTGRKADAFAAFSAMLEDPHLVTDSKARVAVHAEIHNRLRVCYEREGCFGPALVEAGLAYASRVKEYAISGHDEQVRDLRANEVVDRHFKPLLERARVAHAGIKFRCIVDEHLKTLPMVDTNALRGALDAFRLNPPAPPQRVVERVAGKLYMPELQS